MMGSHGQLKCSVHETFADARSDGQPLTDADSEQLQQLATG
jgi:hypothetical protein